VGPNGKEKDARAAEAFRKGGCHSSEKSRFSLKGRPLKGRREGEKTGESTPRKNCWAHKIDCLPESEVESWWGSGREPPKSAT